MGVGRGALLLVFLRGVATAVRTPTVGRAVSVSLRLRLRLRLRLGPAAAAAARCGVVSDAEPEASVDIEPALRYVEWARGTVRGK